MENLIHNKKYAEGYWNAYKQTYSKYFIRKSIKGSTAEVEWQNHKKEIEILTLNIDFSIYNEEIELLGLEKEILYIVLSFIISPKYNNTDTSINYVKYYKNREYNELNSKALKAIVSDKYLKHLKFLLDKNIVVEYLNKHNKNGWCSGYSRDEKGNLKKTGYLKSYKKYKVNFNNPILFSDIIDINNSFLNYKLTNKRYINNYIKQIEAYCKYKDVQSNITDEDTVYNYLAENVKKCYYKMDNSVIDYIKQDKEYSYYKSADILSRMFNFNQGFIYYKKDTYGNRFHSNITNTSKLTKKFLKFKGYENEKYCEIDIKNSQFFFLSIINYKILKELNLEAFWYKFKEWFEKDTIKQLLQLCRNGSLYQKVADILNVKGKIIDYTDSYAQFNTTANKDNVKKQLIELTFANMDERANNPALKNYLEIDFIKDYFLMLDDFDYTVKYTSSKATPQSGTAKETSLVVTNDNKEKKNRLSQILQQVESHFLLQKLIVKLKDAWLDDFVTIHDSFIILKKNLDEFKECLHNLFKEYDIHIKENVNYKIENL